MRIIGDVTKIIHRSIVAGVIGFADNTDAVPEFHQTLNEGDIENRLAIVIGEPEDLLGRTVGNFPAELPELP